MKTATVTINIGQEKLKALQFYAGKKEADLQGELEEFLQKLYEKYVPAQTREYIESQTGQVREQPKRPSQPSRPVPQTALVATIPTRQQTGRTES